MYRYLIVLALALYLPLAAWGDITGQPRVIDGDTLEIAGQRNLLIQQYGEDAPIFAGQQADKCLAAGDLDGKAVWMGVIRAIEELRRTSPKPNEAMQ